MLTLAVFSSFFYKAEILLTPNFHAIAPSMTPLSEKKTGKTTLEEGKPLPEPKTVGKLFQVA